MRAALPPPRKPAAKMKAPSLAMSDMLPETVDSGFKSSGIRRQMILTSTPKENKTKTRARTSTPTKGPSFFSSSSSSSSHGAIKEGTITIETGKKLNAEPGLKVGRKRAEAYAYSSSESAAHLQPPSPLQQLIELTGLGVGPAASLLGAAQGSVPVAAQAFLEDFGG